MRRVHRRRTKLKSIPKELSGGITGQSAAHKSAAEATLCTPAKQSLSGAPRTHAVRFACKPSSIDLWVPDGGRALREADFNTEWNGRIARRVEVQDGQIPRAVICGQVPYRIRWSTAPCRSPMKERR